MSSTSVVKSETKTMETKQKRSSSPTSPPDAPMWLSPSNDPVLIPILTEAASRSPPRRSVRDRDMHEDGSGKSNKAKKNKNKNKKMTTTSTLTSTDTTAAIVSEVAARIIPPQSSFSTSSTTIQPPPLQGRPSLPFVSSFSTLAAPDLSARTTKRPNRWVDFFCIVGLDKRPQKNGGTNSDGGHSGNDNDDEGEWKPRTGRGGKNQKGSINSPSSSSPTIRPSQQDQPTPQEKQKQQQQQEQQLQYEPIVLDSYPLHRPDMEFPQHIATFCFPTGCHPIKVKKRRTQAITEQGGKNSGGGVVVIKQNLPDPTLCTIVLTSGSGHRLYGTTLMIYEEWDMDTTNHGMAPPSPRSERPPKCLKKTKADTAGTTSRRNDSEQQHQRQEFASDDATSYTYLVPKSYVLLSHYPFFHVQAAMLKELFYTVQSGVSPIPLERFVAHMVDDVPLPSPPGQTKVEWNSWTTKTVGDGTTLTVQVPSITAVLYRPPPNRLPLLNVSSYEPLFRTLSLSNVLVLWATLLQEGKVILCCRSKETVGLLTPIAQALLSLLFPLEWQGMYIPLLPNPTTGGEGGSNHNNNNSTAMDILEAPVPYLVGLCLPDSNDQQHHHHHPHPPGVVWCDLEDDIVHLGWADNGSIQEGVPALPEAASMRLKAELEEVADPLFLPPTCGIKGRMTVGGCNSNRQQTTESGQYPSLLENASRDPPYAPMTRLFHDGNPRPTPRAYILTQSSKVPPRGRPLRYDDFWLNDGKETNSDHGPGSTWDGLGSFLCPIQIQEQENQVPPTRTVPTTETTATVEENSKMAADKDDSNNNTNPSFLTNLKLQSRSLQAHTDRFMSVLGQSFATPSQYANKGDYMGEDILQQQDEIAAKFFDPNEPLQETVRQCFLRFFVSVLGSYRAFVDEETQRLDVVGFVKSLRLSPKNQDFVRDMVQSQMFELFLQDAECNQRRYFDETIIRYHQGQRNRANLILITSTPNNNNSSSSDNNSATPFLDSTRWRLQNVVTPPPPSSRGIKMGQVFLQDRRFPDHLNPAECVTSTTFSGGGGGWSSNLCDAPNNSIPSWADPFCSVFLSCGY